VDLGLTGAAVCVQGGSKGIGRAAAECFAREGARVAVLARDRSAIDETVDRLAQLGSPESFGVVADVGDAQAVEQAFAQIADRWQELNALVCSAGPTVSHRAWDEVTDEQYLNSFVVGALSSVRCARAALPLLRSAQWARIVNIAAMSSRCQGPGLADYSAAKAALTSITKNLSLELAAEGILANTVSPGTVITEQLARHIQSLPPEMAVTVDDPKAVMKFISQTFSVRSDLGRAGLPDELAAVICFLASRRNSYMTGANINVDAGSSFFA
jgi:3-oxoacyl-[acyl-carrier protein] reductase